MIKKKLLLYTLIIKKIFSLKLLTFIQKLRLLTIG